MHQELLPQVRTVNTEYYFEFMRRLRETIRKKRPELWKNNSWLLHHDNAPAHSSLLVRNFLAKNNTLIMPQPPYSPDLAPCDFFLFPRLKRPMKRRRFATIEEIKTESLKKLKDIPKSAYEKCFEEWKKRWHKYIISEGDYFEGDNIEIHKLINFFNRPRILTEAEGSIFSSLSVENEAKYLSRRSPSPIKSECGEVSFLSFTLFSFTIGSQAK